jgi:hydrogenase expression/formation protein HypC
MAIPGRIVWIGETAGASIPGRIETGATTQEIDLIMVPDAAVGDYVVSHSGYAIKLVPADSAEGTLRLLGIDM